MRLEEDSDLAMDGRISPCGGVRVPLDPVATYPLGFPTHSTYCFVPLM